TTSARWSTYSTGCTWRAAARWSRRWRWPPAAARNRRVPMDATRRFLESLGLPRGDAHDLPTSPKRFPDGAQYRVEIPSTEGPRCLEAVLGEATRLGVPVHRVSQGSGVFLHTDGELDEMAATAARARVEVSLFTRPNAAWGT